MTNCKQSMLLAKGVARLALAVEGARKILALAVEGVRKIFVFKLFDLLCHVFL